MRQCLPSPRWLRCATAFPHPSSTNRRAHTGKVLAYAHTCGHTCVDWPGSCAFDGRRSASRAAASPRSTGASGVGGGRLTCRYTCAAGTSFACGKGKGVVCGVDMVRVWGGGKGVACVGVVVGCGGMYGGDHAAKGVGAVAQQKTSWSCRWASLPPSSARQR
eukprot:296808-Chlamydomonas_euryale.AAC.1